MSSADPGGNPAGATSTTEMEQEAPQREVQRPNRVLRNALLIGAAVVLVLLLLALFVATRGGTDEAVPTAEVGEKLYPERPDARPDDQERRVGGEAGIADVTAILSASAFAPNFQNGSNYMVVRVALTSNSPEPRQVGPSDFRLVTPDGELLPSAEVTAPDLLEETTLQQGEVAPGVVYFDVGDRTGPHWVEWNLVGEDAPVGAWQIPVGP